MKNADVRKVIAFLGALAAALAFAVTVGFFWNRLSPDHAFWGDAIFVALLCSVWAYAAYKIHLWLTPFCRSCQAKPCRAKPCPRCQNFPRTSHAWQEGGKTCTCDAPPAAGNP